MHGVRWRTAPPELVGIQWIAQGQYSTADCVCFRYSICFADTLNRLSACYGFNLERECTVKMIPLAANQSQLHHVLLQRQCVGMESAHADSNSALKAILPGIHGPDGDAITSACTSAFLKLRPVVVAKGEEVMLTSG